MHQRAATTLMTASTTITPMSARALKRRERAEFFKTGINLGAGESAEALHAKLLAAEAPHHRTVDDSAAQIAAADVAGFEIEALLGQVSDESSGEAVAGAGRVEHVFEQVTGHDEIRVVAEQHRAVFASLDDQRVRTHIENCVGGFAQILATGEHARLAIVDEQKIPIADGGEQLVAKILDPEIHGIAAGQAKPVHLLAHGTLQRGLDISEQKIRLAAVTGGKFGIEIGEHVQLRGERDTIVHIIRILS